MFSPEQDVEIGRSVAAAAERQLPMLKDVRVDAYLNWLGRRLAEKAREKSILISSSRLRKKRLRDLDSLQFP